MNTSIRFQPTHRGIINKEIIPNTTDITKDKIPGVIREAKCLLSLYEVRISIQGNRKPSPGLANLAANILEINLAANVHKFIGRKPTMEQAYKDLGMSTKVVALMLTP